jgi:flavin reductase (DIM6/NTAB) family NADH-FMN oxidoreductase RutF
VSEFEACGFTEVYSEGIRAPYVGESPIRIGLEYVEEHEIKANGTILIVGKVLEVQVPEAMLAETGHVELDKAGSIGVAGLDSYYSASLEKRLPYARVEEEER